jgi:hypothetical protein
MLHPFITYSCEVCVWYYYCILYYNFNMIHCQKFVGELLVSHHHLWCCVCLQYLYIGGGGWGDKLLQTVLSLEQMYIMLHTSIVD